MIEKRGGPSPPRNFPNMREVGGAVASCPEERLVETRREAYGAARPAEAPARDHRRRTEEVRAQCEDNEYTCRHLVPRGSPEHAAGIRSCRVARTVEVTLARRNSQLAHRSFNRRA